MGLKILLCEYVHKCSVYITHTFETVVFGAALFPDIFDFRNQKIKVICQLGNVADRIGRLTIQKQLGLVLTVSYHEKSYCSTTTMSPRQGSESRSPSSKTLIFDIFAYFDHVIYIF